MGLYWSPYFLTLFINDLFLFIGKFGVCNFVDDNTLYSVGKSIENIISDLKTDLIGVMEWFKINSLKANPCKFQFKVLGNKEDLSISILITLKLNTQTK